MTLDGEKTETGLALASSRRRFICVQEKTGQGVDQRSFRIFIPQAQLENHSGITPFK